MIFRGSHEEVFAKFTDHDLCWSFVLDKLQTGDRRLAT